MLEGATWWVRSGDGVARRVTAGGLLIGRSPHCDIVVPSPRVSRRQAMLYLADKGPRIEVIGRATTSVGDRKVARAAYLERGDRIILAGLELEVECEPASRAPSGAWVIEDPGGALFGMVSSPFVVGGSADDDLRVEAWPPGALRLHNRSGRLEVETEVEVRIDGRPAPPGIAQLGINSVVELSGARVRVVTGGAFGRDSTVAAPGGAPAVRAVRLEFLPRGGRLHVELEDGTSGAVYVSDRRCDLLAVLLRPPEPYAPGDFVEDDVVIPRVWARGVATRERLNVLLHRVRKDFARAGLDGARLLERSQGGGATRVVLAQNARVELG